MPFNYSYPGVYVEEVPSGVRTITGVSTSITAFIGRAVRGEVNEPILILSYADFERTFGGLHIDYPMSYAVKDFFLNGGSQALIVRLYKPETSAEHGFSFAEVEPEISEEVPVPPPQSLAPAHQTLRRMNQKRKSRSPLKKHRKHSPQILTPTHRVRRLVLMSLMRLDPSINSGLPTPAPGETSCALKLTMRV